MIFESANDTLLLGNLRITRLSDGHVPWTIQQVVTNGPIAEAQAEMDRLEEGHDPTHHRCLRVSCLLIETPDRRILVDTGWGRWPFAMRVPDSEPVTAHLARLGYQPSDIDTVVLSHAHPDHIGGNCVEVDGALRPRYSQARYHLHQRDWDHYTAPDVLTAPYFASNLPPLAEAGVIELVDQETQIAPGVTILPTPGHSPGHCCVVITAEHETAIYLGDVAHHPLHLEHPEWNAVFDVLPAMARDTRRWLYEKIATERPWVIGCHFLSPGIGTLERRDPGYRWNELTGDYPPKP